MSCWAVGVRASTGSRTDVARDPNVADTRAGDGSAPTGSAGNGGFVGRVGGGEPGDGNVSGAEARAQDRPGEQR